MRADIRAQELQLELLHASRLSTAGQMAGALAHELNQPLTAFTNSVNPARRMMTNASHRVGAICDILTKAADQALRAGEIIRRLREFVKRGETENADRKPGRGGWVASAGTGSAQICPAGLARGRAVRAPWWCSATAFSCNRSCSTSLRNAHEAMAQSECRELEVATARLGNESIEIAVADHGPGLSDGIAGHLFELSHHEKQWHGIGSLDLPFNRRSSRRHVEL